MSRLTNQSYLRQRNHLRDCWITRPGSFANLSPTRQWDLHAYFKLSEDLTDEDALAHRARLTKARPSLPHRAGKAYRQFVDSARTPALVWVSSGPKKSEQVIRIRSVVRPQPDFAKLARVLKEVLDEKEKDRPDDSSA